MFQCDSCGQRQCVICMMSEEYTLKGAKRVERPTVNIARNFMLDILALSCLNFMTVGQQASHEIIMQQREPLLLMKV